MGKADLNKDKFGNDPVNSFIQLKLFQCFLKSVYCFCKANKIRRKYRISSCENNRKYLKWKQKWKKGPHVIICMDNEWRTRILKIHCSRVIYANIYVWISWATFGDWFLAWDFSTHAHSGSFIHTTKNLRRFSKFILSKTDLSYF